MRVAKILNFWPLAAISKVFEGNEKGIRKYNPYCILQILKLFYYTEQNLKIPSKNATNKTDNAIFTPALQCLVNPIAMLTFRFAHGINFIDNGMNVIDYRISDFIDYWIVIYIVDHIIDFLHHGIKFHSLSK